MHPRSFWLDIPVYVMQPVKAQTEHMTDNYQTQVTEASLPSLSGYFSILTGITPKLTEVRDNKFIKAAILCTYLGVLLNLMRLTSE